MDNYDDIYMRDENDLMTDVAHLKRQLTEVEVERDRYKTELERLRANLGSICPDPNCSTNNPRT